MSGQKKILIKSYSPHALYHDFENIWDDLWLHFKNRRRAIRLCPCVSAESYIDFEIENNEQILRESIEELKSSPTKTVDFGGATTTIEHAKMIADCREEISRWRCLKDRFANGDNVVIDDSYGENIPEIYIRGQVITRLNIETALEQYLQSRGYISLGSRPKFVWKRPRFLIRSFPE